MVGLATSSGWAMDASPCKRVNGNDLARQAIAKPRRPVMGSKGKTFALKFGTVRRNPATLGAGRGVGRVKGADTG
jgi:hypothetical protein